MQASKKHIKTGLILLASLLFGFLSTTVRVGNAQEDFNILFTSSDSVLVDATRIQWSTSKEAECFVRYGENPDTTSGLLENGVFVPVSNSANQGRYHFVAILKELKRNVTYYFRIHCSSKYENNKSAVSDTLSFLSSVGFFDRPDLTVTDINFNPTPIKGKLYNGSLNIKIKNIGNKNTESANGILVKVGAVNGNTGGTHPLVCDLCDPNSHIGVLSTANLAVGETRIVSFNLKNTPFNFDTFNVRASVDSNALDGAGVVTEITEGNNLFTKDFKINIVSTPATIPSTTPVTSPKATVSKPENGDVGILQQIVDDESEQSETVEKAEGFHLSSNDATAKLEEKKTAKEVSYDTIIDINYLEDKSEYDFLVGKNGRFLFFVPKIVEIKIVMSAENGDIKDIKKPWWSFLVNE